MDFNNSVILLFVLLLCTVLLVCLQNDVSNYMMANIQQIRQIQSTPAVIGGREKCKSPREIMSREETTMHDLNAAAMGFPPDRLF